MLCRLHLVLIHADGLCELPLVAQVGSGHGFQQGTADGHLARVCPLFGYMVEDDLEAARQRIGGSDESRCLVSTVRTRLCNALPGAAGSA